MTTDPVPSVELLRQITSGAGGPLGMALCLAGLGVAASAVTFSCFVPFLGTLRHGEGWLQSWGPQGPLPALWKAPAMTTSLLLLALAPAVQDDPSLLTGPLPRPAMTSEFEQGYRVGRPAAATARESAANAPGAAPHARRQARIGTRERQLSRRSFRNRKKSGSPIWSELRTPSRDPMGPGDPAKAGRSFATA